MGQGNGSWTSDKMAMVDFVFIEKEQAEDRKLECVVELKQLYKSICTSLEEAQAAELAVKSHIAE